MFGKVIAVAAGKGGVGKSTMSAFLAQMLEKKGNRVGVIDADLYGPSLSQILKPDFEPQVSSQKLKPARSGSINYISSSFFGYEEKPAAVRAPLANHMITQFVDEVLWGDLDYLIVDFPPGTGDIQLTLLQKLNFDGAILVTTPQKVSLKDVHKAHQMFTKMQVKVYGVIENMSYFSFDETQRVYPFGEGHVLGFCELNDLAYLGQIPVDDSISKSCDEGLNLPESVSKNVLDAFNGILDKVFSISQKEGSEVSFEISWNQDM